ncbi:MAG: signal peptidase I [Bacteroidota bacterium]|nr:signal peptidase I [Bacteroidota bacterium]
MKLNLKFNILGGVILCLLFVIVNIIFNLFYDIYYVKSPSMCPTLRTGDFILVKKKSQEKVESYNVYVFKLPCYKSNEIFFADDINSLFIKRCVGLPGDTLLLYKDKLIVNDIFQEEYAKFIKMNEHPVGLNIYDLNSHYYYPHDTLFLWSSFEYGPIIIPNKGRTIVFGKKSKLLYNDIVLYEKRDLLNNDSYRFRNDYYFFMGDNLSFSTDSRHFGPIPESAIIGEAKFVLFSWSKNNPFFISRIFKKIQ